MSTKLNNRKSFLWMVGLLVLAFVIFFVLGALYFSQERKQILQKKLDELHAISNSKINQLVELHRSHFSFVNYLSSTEPFLQYIREIVKGDLTNANLFKENLISSISIKQIKTILLTDSTGVVLLEASTPRNSQSIAQNKGVLIDSYTLKAIKEVFDSGEHHVNAYLDNMPAGTAPYMFISPVVDKNSNVIATMVSIVDATEYLVPILDQWSELHTSNASVLARKEADSVRVLDPTNKLAKVDFVTVKPYLDLVKRLNFKIEDKGPLANLGFYTGLDLENRQVVGKVTKILNSQWHLVEQTHYSQVFNTINKKASYAAIIGAIAFLFSLTALLGIHYHKKRNQKNKLLISEKEGEEFRRSLAETRLELWNFSTNNNLETTLREMLDKVSSITNSLFAFVFFLEPDQETISLAAWSTATENKFSSFIEKVSLKSITTAGVWAEAIKTKKPLIHNNFADVPNKKGVPQGHPVLDREIVVPVIRKDKVVAVLGVANKPTLYSSNDLFLASYLADVILEISRSKFKEEALRKSEEKYKSFFYDHSAINVIIDPSNGVIVDANNSAVQFYGWPLEELKKMNMSEINILPFNDVKELAETAVGSANSLFELEQKRADGSLVDVDVFTGRVYIEDKLYISAIIHDVTLKKHRERAQDILYSIAKSSMDSITLGQLVTTLKQGLASLLDVSNLYIALYDPQKEMFRVEGFKSHISNEVHWVSTGGIMGYVFKSEEPLLLSSKEIAPFVLEHNLTPLDDTPESLLCQPLVYNDNAIGVLILKSYKGSKGYDSNNLKLMALVAYELSSAIARFKLIEDLVKARAQAEESTRLKSAFIANLSHEVRTPVNAIVGFLDLLSDPNLSDKHRNLSVEQIKKGSDRLTKTLNNLIEVSEIESGSININKTSIDVNHLLNSLYNHFINLSTSKGVSLRLDIKTPTNLSIVQTDEQKLITILFELLTNSFKFTKEGSIELGNYIKGDKICFYVDDTGCGIESNKIGSLFNYFETIDVNLTREYRGIGLGLPIVKSYVEALGGTIKVNSEVGKFTSIHFCLPL